MLSGRSTPPLHSSMKRVSMSSAPAPAQQDTHTCSQAGRQAGRVRQDSRTLSLSRQAAAVENGEHDSTAQMSPAATHRH